MEQVKDLKELITASKAEIHLLKMTVSTLEPNLMRIREEFTEGNHAGPTQRQVLGDDLPMKCSSYNEIKGITCCLNTITTCTIITMYFCAYIPISDLLISHNYYHSRLEFYQMNGQTTASDLSTIPAACYLFVVCVWIGGTFCFK